MTGSTPDSSSATQTAAPTIAAAGPRHAGRRVAKRDQRDEERRRESQRDELDVLGVNGRDHQQGDQVVDHQHGEEAYPQPLGAARDRAPGRPARTPCRSTSRRPSRALPGRLR